MQLSKKKLKTMRANILEITPEITGILDDLANIQKMRLPAKDRDGNKTSAEAAAKTGIEMAKQFIDMLLVRQYGGIIRILGVIYETDPNELEEKTMEEIVDMVFETLGDKTLWRFFPQLARLAPKTQSDI